MSDKLSIEIPDEAINYIVSHYLTQKNTDTGAVVVGISGEATRDILNLFLKWAEQNNFVKDGILIMGGKPIG